jgi:hypothetical protein
LSVLVFDENECGREPIVCSMTPRSSTRAAGQRCGCARVAKEQKCCSLGDRGERSDRLVPLGDGPLGFALDADAGERLVFGDVTVLIRASAETTRGAFTFIEEIPPMVDTPLHVRAREHENVLCARGRACRPVRRRAVPPWPWRCRLSPARYPAFPTSRLARRGTAARSNLAGRIRGVLSVSWPRPSARARLDLMHTLRRPSATASPGSAETARIVRALVDRRRRSPSARVGVLAGTAVRSCVGRRAGVGLVRGWLAHVARIAGRRSA